MTIMSSKTYSGLFEKCDKQYEILRLSPASLRSRIYGVRRVID